MERSERCAATLTSPTPVDDRRWSTEHPHVMLLFLALFISIILLGFNPFLFLDYFVANLIVLQFEISACMYSNKALFIVRAIYLVGCALVPPYVF